MKISQRPGYNGTRESYKVRSWTETPVKERPHWGKKGLPAGSKTGPLKSNKVSI